MSSGPSIGTMIEELRPFVGDGISLKHPIVSQARSAWEYALTGAPQTREQSRQLLVYFGIEVLRDRLLADVVNPAARTSQDYDEVFLGSDTRPDIQRLAKAGHVLTEIARCFEEDVDKVQDMASSLSCVAWIMWMMGGSQENVNLALKSAMYADPKHPLAQVLAVLILSAKAKPRWMAA